MFIVSFVNQILSPGLRLGVFNDTFDKFHYLDDFFKNDSIGATGIAFDLSKKLIYVAYQSGGIAVFNSSFEVLQYFKDRNIKDPHSIQLYNNKLYVVSTGNDSVHEISRNTKGHCLKLKNLWKYESKEKNADTVHLNSIVIEQGRTLISLFGEKEKDENWEKVRNGKIYRIDKKQILLDDLHGPHTIVKHGNQTFFCNSSTGELLDLNGNLIYKTNGYLRGLEFYGNKIYIGKNKRRLIAKNSSKILRGRVGSYENDMTRSEIEIVDFKTRKKIKSIPFDHYGREIYDIRHVPFKILVNNKSPEKLRLENIEENFILKIKKIEDHFLMQIKNNEQESQFKIKKVNEVKTLELKNEKSSNGKVEILENFINQLQNEIPVLHNQVTTKSDELLKSETALQSEIGQRKLFEDKYKSQKKVTEDKLDDIKALQNEKAERTQEINQLFDRIKFLENVIGNHESDLSNRNEIIQKQENKFHKNEIELNNKLIRWQNEKSSNEKVGILEKFINQLQKEIPVLHNQVVTKSDELLKSETALHSEIGQRKLFEDKYRSQKKVTEDKLDDIKALQNEKDQIINKILYAEKLQKEEIKSLLKSKTEVDSKINLLESITQQQEKEIQEKTFLANQIKKQKILDNKEIKSKIEYLEKITTHQEKELQEKSNIINQNENQKNEFKNELLKLSSNFSSLKSELSKAHNKINFLESLNSKTELELIFRNQLIIDGQKQVNDLTEKIAILKQKLSALKKNHLNEEKIVEKLKEKISETENLISQLRIKHSEQTNKMQVLESINQGNENELNERIKLIGNIELENRNWSDQCSQLLELKKKSNTKLVFFEKLISEHESELNNKNHVIFDLQRKLELTQGNIKGYKNQARSLAEDISDIKKSYSWQVGYKLTKVLKKLFGWTSFLKNRV